MVGAPHGVSGTETRLSLIFLNKQCGIFFLLCVLKQTNVTVQLHNNHLLVELEWFAVYFKKAFSLKHPYWSQVDEDTQKVPWCS